MDFRINFAMVDFPEPDSPAKTKTSPLFIVNDTSSAAFTIVSFELKTLFFTKCFVRFSTRKISSNYTSIILQYIKRLDLKIWDKAFMC